MDPVRYRDVEGLREKWDEVRRLQDEVCAGFEIVFVPSGRSADATGIGAKTAMEAIGIIATYEMAFLVQALKGETKDAVLRSSRRRASSDSGGCVSGLPSMTRGRVRGRHWRRRLAAAHTLFRLVLVPPSLQPIHF